MARVVYRHTEMIVPIKGKNSIEQAYDEIQRLRLEKPELTELNFKYSLELRRLKSGNEYLTIKITDLKKSWLDWSTFWWVTIGTLIVMTVLHFF